MVKVSIIIPFHFGKDWDLLLSRCLQSIEMQTFTEYEILLLKLGRAAQTQNSLMERARGEIVKILHADDFFTEETSLQQIVNHFDSETIWMATGCLHAQDFGQPKYPHLARYSEDIHTGNNTIGAPSVLAFRNDLGITFDEDLDWLYDVSLYKKLFDSYGPPKILDEFPVTIGLHSGQLTHAVSEEQKHREVELMKTRYV